MKWVSDLESQKFVNPTVGNPQLQPQINSEIPQNNAYPLISTLHSGIQLTGNTQMQAAHAPSASTATSQATPSGLPTPPTEQLAQFTMDGIVPNINVLRQNQSVPQSVSKVLASYEAQARQDAIQGKPPSKKSGRYNTTEAVASVPELRWPNEGYKGYKVRGKQCTMSSVSPNGQWVS